MEWRGTLRWRRAAAGSGPGRVCGVCGVARLQLKRSLQYVFCFQKDRRTPCTAAVHVSLVKVCVCLCVCERARVKTDLRTICAAATSDGHRVVLRRRVPPCTHTHTHTHYYQGGWAYRECAQGDFWLENMQLIYYVGLVRTQCAYAGVSEHTDA